MTTDLNVTADLNVVEVEVRCFCGHIERVVVENTPEDRAWAKEDAVSRNCNHCDEVSEREWAEKYDAMVSA